MTLARRSAPILFVLASFLSTSHAFAQTTRLTLADALRIAEEHSEALTITQAGEARASADEMRVQSQRRPQVNFIGSFDRTLASEFSGAFQSSGPVCAGLNVDATKSVADRVAELERAASCGAIGPTLNFSNLPFGQRNVYRATISFSQTVYTGGRLEAQRAQADVAKHLASLATSAAGAQLALDVTRAFYDAALSDRLLAIAQSGYDQASAAYDQARLAFAAGRQPEFELLRAQVTRDNTRPAVIRSQANRDVAYLRLRQLLELPVTADVRIDVDLDAATLPAPAPFAESLTKLRPPSAEVDRTGIHQAEGAVEVRQAAIAVARAERLPALSLNSTFGQVGYPSNPFLPGANDFRSNWTMGASVQVPILNGNRLKADELVARADLQDAQARLKQTRELSDLDVATARQDLAAAEAVWEAGAGTVQQAQRAYEIAELRYREGVSTLLELSDSRLSLQVAQANRAQAARDLQIARAHVALLPALPIGAR